MNNYIKELNNNGIFYINNFIKEVYLLDNIYNKVNNKLKEINNEVSKEYIDYFVEDKYSLKSSNELYNKNKTTFNFRGLSKNKLIKKTTYEYDNGFCDITRAELLFDDLLKLDLSRIYEVCNKIKPDFNKNKDIMYNIYYTKSVTDTRTWHRDGNIIKFFIYLQDVNIKNGPYSYITNSSNIKLDKNNEISNDNLEILLNENHKKYIFENNKGTLICSNQNGIHRGQPQKIGYSRIILVIRLFNI